LFAPRIFSDIQKYRRETQLLDPLTTIFNTMNTANLAQAFHPHHTFIHGDEIIGKLYQKKVLIPFTIDPWA